MNLPNFFAELRRRNVYKVAVAHGIAGWLLICGGVAGVAVLPGGDGRGAVRTDVAV
jgi:hypothetical protein